MVRTSPCFSYVIWRTSELSQIKAQCRQQRNRLDTVALLCSSIPVAIARPNGC